MQSSPGGFSDGHFVFSLTTGRQKDRNLQANPSIVVSGTDPDNPYRGHPRSLLRRRTQ